MNKLVTIFVCCVAVTLSHVKAQAEVEVDRLFHGNPPTLSNTNRPAAQAPTDQEHSEPFRPYRGSRHDEFDFALMKRVLLADDKNAVLSPFIVKTLLSILAEASGPNTTTHRELASVTPSLATISDIREHYGKAYGSLLTPSADYELNLGAKMFVDDFIQPQQKFASIMKHNYYSDIEQVDFTKGEETAKIINAWCSNATKNHINDIVTPDDVERAVIMLINTIYFNGFWSKPFPENKTKVETFFINSKTTAPVQFMHSTDEFYYADAPELGAKILRLPYIGNKFAMNIILPNRLDDIDQLISHIDSSILHRMQYLMEKIEVTVSLPKFKILNTVQLNDILKALGIKQMFTLEASFAQLVRGIAVQDRLQVSSVLQKTGIEVNEKGSTVYSAAVASLVNKFGGEIEFKANHPFIFTIEDESTGTLLFTGKVTKPE